MKIKIKDKLLSDIVKYCNINDISDINEEINKFIEIGFNVTKYGNTPFSKGNEKINEQNIEKINENNKKIRIIKND